MPCADACSGGGAGRQIIVAGKSIKINRVGRIRLFSLALWRTWTTKHCILEAISLKFGCDAVCRGTALSPPSSRARLSLDHHLGRDYEAPHGERTPRHIMASL